MEKEEFKRKIVLETEQKKEMAEALSCTMQMIHQSLNYYKDSKLAKSIRIEAIRRGGEDCVLIPVNRAWIESQGKIENYLTGDCISKK